MSKQKTASYKKPSWLARATPFYGVKLLEENIDKQRQVRANERARKLNEYFAKREKRYYEAAGLIKPDVSSTGPNLRTSWQAKPLRDQARFLYDNDPTTRQIVDAFVTGLIGKGFTFLVKRKEGDPDANIETIETLFNDWSSTTICDHDSLSNLMGMCSTVLRAWVLDGGVFVRFIRWPKNDVPIQLQVLEYDYLDVSMNKSMSNGHSVINGIEYDKNDREVAYYLYDMHPDDRMAGGSFTLTAGGLRNKSLRDTVRVTVAEISFVRNVSRPGQREPVSLLAPVLMTIWDLREYKEAQLKKQKIQACIPAVVVDTALPDDLVGDMLDEDFTLGVETKDIGTTIEPGSVQSLPYGKDIKFPNASTVPNELFVERALRDIAGALGLAYEVFDYSKVNFSSARMGFLQTTRTFERVFNAVLVPQFLDKLGRRFVGALKTADHLPENYEDALIRWVPDHREMVDPQKEVDAVIALLQAGLISMKEAHARLGFDFTKNIEEIKESEDILKSHGLKHFIPIEVSPPAM